MADPTVIAWLDLETTTSNENARCAAIIEVGVVFTDFDLNELGEIHSTINPGLDKRLMLAYDENPTYPILPDTAAVNAMVWEDMDPFVQNMHTVNGLWEEVTDSPVDVEFADVWLKGWLEREGNGAQVALAGSGVSHFDSRWLRKFLPQASKQLTYYAYDVGVLRRFLRDICKFDVTLADVTGTSSGPHKAHRAVDDARAHLDEARALRGFLADKW